MHVTASGGDYIFALGTDDQIYRCPKPCFGNGEWENVPGLLTQCDATSDALFGVNVQENIWRRSTGI